MYPPSSAWRVAAVDCPRVQAAAFSGARDLMNCASGRRAHLSWAPDGYRQLGSGDAAPGVAEVGDHLQFPAERANVVAEGGEFGHGTALDGGDALLGHSHRLRDLGLGQAGLLAHLGQVLGPDLQRPPLAGFLHGRPVIGVDELVQELLARVGEELRFLAHRCLLPFRYASYAASAAGIASRYHWSHRPDLSPATSSTALRAGSKMNKIRTSAVPLEPGRSSLRLCSRDPAIRSASGRPSAGPSSSSRSMASATSPRVTGSPDRSACSQSRTWRVITSWCGTAPSSANGTTNLLCRYAGRQ